MLFMEVCVTPKPTYLTTIYNNNSDDFLVFNSQIAKPT